MSTILGSWNKIGEDKRFAPELKAFNTARKALEDKITKAHPGAVFSYKRGDAVYALPVTGAPAKANGKADPAALAQALALLKSMGISA